MLDKTTLTKQKQMGAYYTPQTLVDNIVSLYPPQACETILEPSCGDGRFIAAVHDKAPFLRIDGVELNVTETTKLCHRYADMQNVNIFNEDFFAFYERNKGTQKYDYIIGNPPYLRYQYLSDEQREALYAMLKANHVKATKLFNLWASFMVACTSLLSDEGKLIFVVPAEIMQVNYARHLRKYLMEQFTHITLITFSELVFEEAEQNVVIFVGDKQGTKKGLRIVQTKNAETLATCHPTATPYSPMSKSQAKWTEGFMTNQDAALLRKMRKDERFAPLSDFAIVNVGVTTGRDHYFTLTNQAVQQFGLEGATVPLLGRSFQVSGLNFTEQDLLNGDTKGHCTHLVSFPDTPYDQYPASYKAYIQKGEEAGLHTTYKCSIRKKWYIVPSIWVPDAFLLRRSHKYAKLVANDCNAVSTATMHRLKFRENIDRNDVLLGYYNSVTFAAIELSGRSYGGGVLDLLPSEAQQIPIPKINGIDKTLQERLLKQIDVWLRADEDIERVLDMVDDVVLVQYLGIDKTICERCRAIWKQYQGHRLKRNTKATIDKV